MMDKVITSNKIEDESSLSTGRRNTSTQNSSSFFFFAQSSQNSKNAQSLVQLNSMKKFDMSPLNKIHGNNSKHSNSSQKLVPPLNLQKNGISNQITSQRLVRSILSLKSFETARRTTPTTNFQSNLNSDQNTIVSKLGGTLRLNSPENMNFSPPLNLNGSSTTPQNDGLTSASSPNNDYLMKGFRSVRSSQDLTNRNNAAASQNTIKYMPSQASSYFNSPRRQTDQQYVPASRNQEREAPSEHLHNSLQKKQSLQERPARQTINGKILFQKLKLNEQLHQFKTDKNYNKYGFKFLSLKEKLSTPKLWKLNQNKQVQANSTRNSNLAQQQSFLSKTNSTLQLFNNHIPKNHRRISSLLSSASAKRDSSDSENQKQVIVLLDTFADTHQALRYCLLPLPQEIRHENVNIFQHFIQKVRLALHLPQKQYIYLYAKDGRKIDSLQDLGLEDKSIIASHSPVCCSALSDSIRAQVLLEQLENKLLQNQKERRSVYGSLRPSTQATSNNKIENQSFLVDQIISTLNLGFSNDEEILNATDYQQQRADLVRSKAQSPKNEQKKQENPLLSFSNTEEYFKNNLPLIKNDKLTKISQVLEHYDNLDKLSVRQQQQQEEEEQQQQQQQQRGGLDQPEFSNTQSRQVAEISNIRKLAEETGLMQRVRRDQRKKQVSPLQQQVSKEQKDQEIVQTDPQMLQNIAEMLDEKLDKLLHEKEQKSNQLGNNLQESQQQQQQQQTEYDIEVDFDAIAEDKTDTIQKPKNFIDTNKRALQGKREVLNRIRRENTGLFERNIPKIMSEIPKMLAAHNQTDLTRNDLHEIYTLYKALHETTSQRYTHGTYNYKDGVDYETYRNCVQQVALQSDEFAARMFRTVDTNYSGFIDWSEFLRLMASIRARSLGDKINLFIQVADEDGNGKLDWKEIRELSRVCLSRYVSAAADDTLLEELSEYFARLIFQAVGVNDEHSEIPLEKIKETIASGHPDSRLLSMFCGADI